MRGPVPTSRVVLLAFILAFVMADAQMQLGAVGQEVTGLDELEQSLRIIVRTPKGSVPGRPTFGVDVFAWVDDPITTLRPKAIRELQRSIPESDARLAILGIVISDPDERGGIPVSITWQPAAGLSTVSGQRTTDVTLGGG